MLIALSLHHHDHHRSNRWLRNIEKQNLEEMIAKSDKVRFEIKDDTIRALYGHSSYRELTAQTTGGYRCNVCDTIFNSMSDLDAHTEISIVLMK